MSGVIGHLGSRSGILNITKNDNNEYVKGPGSWTYQFRSDGAQQTFEEVSSDFRMKTPRPGKYMFYGCFRLVNDGDFTNFGRLRLCKDEAGGTSFNLSTQDLESTDMMIWENYSSATLGAGGNMPLTPLWTNIVVTNSNTNWTLVANSSNANQGLELYSDINGHSRFGFARLSD